MGSRRTQRTSTARLSQAVATLAMAAQVERHSIRTTAYRRPTTSAPIRTFRAGPNDVDLAVNEATIFVLTFETMLRGVLHIFQVEL